MPWNTGPASRGIAARHAVESAGYCRHQAPGAAPGRRPHDREALDHGYAATVHKSQGVTVDRMFVLATQNLDRHSTYVALSRHREQIEVYYGREDFQGGEGLHAPARARVNLEAVLSRARPKKPAVDYIERNVGSLPMAWTCIRCQKCRIRDFRVYILLIFSAHQCAQLRRCWSGNNLAKSIAHF